MHINLLINGKKRNRFHIGDKMKDKNYYSYNVVDLKKRLRELRKKNNLTQNELAEILSSENGSISARTLNNYEDPLNESVPDMKNLIKYCNYFKCDMDYLFGKLDNKTHDIDFICEYTGLNEIAIDLLHDSITDYQAHKKNNEDFTKKFHQYVEKMSCNDDFDFDDIEPFEKQSLFIGLFALINKILESSKLLFALKDFFSFKQGMPIESITVEYKHHKKSETLLNDTITYTSSNDEIETDVSPHINQISIDTYSNNFNHVLINGKKISSDIVNRVLLDSINDELKKLQENFDSEFHRIMNMF